MWRGEGKRTEFWLSGGFWLSGERLYEALKLYA